MDRMIKEQPVQATTTEENSSNFFSQVAKILTENWQQLLRGAGITLLISIIGTIVWSRYRSCYRCLPYCTSISKTNLSWYQN